MVLANAAVGKTGKHKGIVLRDKNIKVDPDFFEIKEEPRFKQTRKIALHAKFTQRDELRAVLIATKKAKLVHYLHRKPAETDYLLMELRKEITIE